MIRLDSRWAVCALLIAASVESATVTRGPYLQSGTPTSVVVRWRTDTGTDSRVYYGDAPGQLDSWVDDPAVLTEHQVTLEYLVPDTKYYYAVGTTAGILAGNDPTYFFVTAPPKDTPKPTRVWVLGDSGTANANARAVRDAYYGFTASRHTDLWLMLGDNAYSDGTDAQYQAAVFDMYPTILRKSVLWPTLGNHDGHTADSGTQSGPYYDIFTLPRNGEAGGLQSGTEAYYSFDYGNIHFIVLDSFDSDRSPSGAMMTWLQMDLAMTTSDWIIAYWHHPPYSKGSHDSDSSGALTDMRKNALPLLEQGGVDLVLSGHSHSYERSFLLDGHYGTSSTLQPGMILDGGDGRPSGSGAYQKPVLGPIAHQGAVYTVAGSSGQTSGGTLNHPVMYLSLSVLGSVILDVNGNRLDAAFLDSTGAIRDTFTILKPPAGNLAPTVSAGADQTIVLPAMASLDGDVTDDGHPEPPSLSTLWSVTSGPGPVVFADAAAIDTTASFSAAGSYVLRLTADDGELTSYDQATVTVYEEGAPNQPPTVEATATPTVFLPATASLGGTVSDDGLPIPPGMVTTSWSKESGPGAVTFANAGTVNTTASFSAAGTYVLRLSANDGEMTAWSDATVVVEQPPQSLDVRVAAGSDDAEESSSGSVSLSSSDLELVNDGSDQTVGMRFDGVSISQGAAIASAYLQFQVDEVSTGATSLKIHAQAADNASPFTTASKNISSRTRTNASVDWVPPPWSTVGQAGADQRTPDIAPLIREVVNRLGWASGNSLVLIVTGTGKRTAEAYNGVPNAAPLLHVEFGPPPPPVNQAPNVSAGPDRTINLPASASLDGTVTDDSLPSPPGQFTVIWSFVSGPDTVTFEAPTAVDTTASFSTAGVYVLRLTADDGELAASDEVTVTVNPPNAPPSVDAGPDQTITLPAAATLDGTVDDDGQPNPPGVVTTTWSKVSGAGNVSFANAGAVDTAASFSATGSYLLRLTAFDGQLTVSDDVAITVEGTNILTVDVRVAASSDDAEESGSGRVSLTSSDLELVFDGSNQTVGMRFNGVSIPRRSTILSAYVQFQVDENTTGAASLKIQAQAVDHAPTFAKTSNNISSREKTLASSDWVPPAWSTVGLAGPDQRTTNIASVIQEVVDRLGWTSGNSLVVLITGTGKRTAESYNGDRAAAPLLHVEFAPPSN